MSMYGNVWQKTLQSCKVISLQLIKISEKKSLLQGHSSKCIYVCHLSVMSYSPCWDLTTKTEFKQYATMRIKTQCPTYIQLAAGEAPVVFKGQACERVTGRKARCLQTEEIGCKCQTFFSLLSGRRKQTSNMFFLLYTNLKGGFS